MSSSMSCAPSRDEGERGEQSSNYDQSTNMTASHSIQSGHLYDKHRRINTSASIAGDGRNMLTEDRAEESVFLDNTSESGSVQEDYSTFGKSNIIENVELSTFITPQEDEKCIPLFVKKKSTGLVYSKTLDLVICLTCECGVQFNNVSKHTSELHPFLVTNQQILVAVTIERGEHYNLEAAESRRKAYCNGSSQPLKHVPGIKVDQGVQCSLCGWCTHAMNSLDSHATTEHPHNPPKWKVCLVQQIFPNCSNVKSFPILPPNISCDQLRAELFPQLWGHLQFSPLSLPDTPPLTPQFSLHRRAKDPITNKLIPLEKPSSTPSKRCVASIVIWRPARNDSTTRSSSTPSLPVAFPVPSQPLKFVSVLPRRRCNSIYARAKPASTLTTNTTSTTSTTTTTDSADHSLVTDSKSSSMSDDNSSSKASRLWSQADLTLLYNEYTRREGSLRNGRCNSMSMRVWGNIAKLFPSRTASAVKNKWNKIVRENRRNMNQKSTSSSSTTSIPPDCPPVTPIPKPISPNPRTSSFNQRPASPQRPSPTPRRPLTSPNRPLTATEVGRLRQLIVRGISDHNTRSNDAPSGRKRPASVALSDSTNLPANNTSNDTGLSPTKEAIAAINSLRHELSQLTSAITALVQQGQRASSGQEQLLSMIKQSMHN